MKKGQKPILYVCRDIERALGMQPSAGYMIVTNRTPYAEKVREQFPEFIHLIETADQQSTLDILKSDVVRRIVADTHASIIVFKNSPQIETLIKEDGWDLLNPKAELAEKAENKISQADWLGGAKKYLPPHTVGLTKDLKWNKQTMVLQWAHGHSGEGTVLVNSAADLAVQQKAFPDRMVRSSDFIRGPSFTVNVVVGQDSVRVGNVSYQITGLAPFTDNPFTTVGNDWSLTHSLLDESEAEEIAVIAKAVGERFRTDGWRGLFGIDVMRDDELNKIFLIEVNARQPASTTFESFLQAENHRLGIPGRTVFEAHIQALHDPDQSPIANGDSQLIIINDGAQIVQRITKLIDRVPEDAAGSLDLAGYITVEYPNTEYNSDLLRIQSLRGIMEAHNKLNKRGKEIADDLGTPIMEIDN